MSEKRHRHQQRRQRRKAKGVARSRARADSLERMLAEVAELAASSIPEVTDAVDAEQWASGLVGTWRHQSLPGEDADAVFFPALVGALEALGTAPALAALRALSAVGAPGLPPAPAPPPIGSRPPGCPSRRGRMGWDRHDRSRRRCWRSRRSTTA